MPGAPLVGTAASEQQPWVPVTNGYGLFAADKNGQLYLGYPSVNGSQRSFRVLTQGAFSGP